MTCPARTEKEERLGALMSMLSGGYIAKGLLVRALCYNSLATFESDISCLRRDYKANISYDKSSKTYHLESIG